MTGAGAQTTRLPRWASILVLSLAGLLLEVGYTRVVSYKLWYYFTYLVIGLALLGIGSGGVVVAVASRLRSYGVQLPADAAAYVDTIFQWPAFQRWLQAALKE